MDCSELIQHISVAFSGRNTPDEADWSFARSDDELRAKQRLSGTDWKSLDRETLDFSDLLSLRGEPFAYYLPAYLVASAERGSPTVAQMCRAAFDYRLQSHQDTIGRLRAIERSALYLFICFSIEHDEALWGSRSEMRNRLRALRYYGCWHHGACRREWENYALDTVGTPFAKADDLVKCIKSMLASVDADTSMDLLSNSDPEAIELVPRAFREKVMKYVFASLSFNVPDAMTVSRKIFPGEREDGDLEARAALQSLTSIHRGSLYLFFEYLFLTELKYSPHNETPRVISAIDYFGSDWQRWHQNEQGRR